MKISSKGRYGLAAMISLSNSYENNEYITIISIAEKLGISKIYLEQVFFERSPAWRVTYRDCGWLPSDSLVYYRHSCFLPLIIFLIVIVDR